MKKFTIIYVAHIIFLLSSTDFGVNPAEAGLRGSPEHFLWIYAHCARHQCTYEKIDEPWKMSAAGVLKWSLSEKEI